MKLLKASIALVMAFAWASPVQAQEKASISRWIGDGYAIVAIIVASDRETGLREVYMQKEDALIVCHISTANAVVGGNGVDLRECFIVDV